MQVSVQKRRQTCFCIATLIPSNSSRNPASDTEISGPVHCPKRVPLTNQRQEVTWDLYLHQRTHGSSSGYPAGTQCLRCVDVRPMMTPPRCARPSHGEIVGCMRAGACRVLSVSLWDYKQAAGLLSNVMSAGWSSRNSLAFDPIRIGDILRWDVKEPERLGLNLVVFKTFRTDVLSDLTGADLATELRLGAQFGTVQLLPSRAREDFYDDSEGEPRVRWYRPPVGSLTIRTRLSDIGGGEMRSRGALWFRARIDTDKCVWHYGVEADRRIALSNWHDTRGFVNVKYMKKASEPEFTVTSQLGIEQYLRLGRVWALTRTGVNPEGTLHVSLRDYGLRSKRAPARAKR